MKARNGFVFTLSAIIIIVFAYLLMFGANLGPYYRFNAAKDLLKLGLDLRGGVYIEMEAVDKNVDQDALERARQMLELRVNNLGVAESTVAIAGGNRIRIEIPGISDAKAALEQVGRTGKLRFVGPDGKEEILTGSDVKDSTVGVDPQTNQPVVQLKLNEAGAKKFAEATKKYIGQPISIYMDEDLISSPTVQNEIPNGEAVITGMKDLDEAKRVAGIIKSGALPVKLQAATVRTIGPSLGAEAIPTSTKAAVIGVSLVMIFMLLYYRVPGFIADLALTVYIILTVLIFIGIKATLTLPGIAGMLLSIGMAVDANVLIFERIKEELKIGKSLKSSIDAGFHRALSSILDSNITTLIAGFVLYYLGSGSVKGFALTLILGVLTSMFTAITITRFMLKTFVNTGWIKNTKFYGA
ncbi:protein translocase subunit SecD [Fonticella tunisiensis]|uniref:Protein translocase subunit SecD n=1 Tax=Fonticella tunisiensis TaxID=1096341 RepID=A0A4R7K6F2_9CLOT|nr:protein translocase subunit SecD [Fonticella tunisiensis]TDT45968.1 preprotein translocase subunit SecD [Fonticella tunisiensis]